MALARKISDADPKDATARHDLGMSLGRLGMIDPGPAEMAESLAVLKEALALVDESTKANSRSSIAASHSAIILEYEGRRLEALGRASEAMETYGESMARIRPFLDAPTPTIMSEYLSNVECTTRLQIAHGKTREALQNAEEALRRTKAYAESNQHNFNRTVLLGRAWALLSLAQSASKMPAQAIEAATESLKQWDSIQKKIQL